VLVPGGDGDAASSDALAAHLIDTHTVLTYDRRGLSGSVLDDPSEPPTVTTHADDLHHLLAALTTDPVFVAGSSIGAMIALELVARHPSQVRLLVAHEPPATQLLAPDDRARARRDQEDVERIFQAEGAVPALLRFGALIGLDPSDREPDSPGMPSSPDRLPNLEFFLTHDAPAVARHRLDLAALKSVGDRIVPAVGESSAHIWPHACARLLAEALGTPYVTFPGGHNGSNFRPRAFAARLREVLDR
jgi:pimeloyl-ACP methyl ester carboxylesterase